MSSAIIQFFAYDHLPLPLQAISQPFYELAMKMETAIPANAEKSVCLRKLLEAKDCAVRAHLFRD